MKGPPRTSKKILQMRGSWLAKTRKDEPSPTAGIPRPPQKLSSEAKAAYYELARTVHEMRVLTHADKAGLVALAETWVARTRAQATIDKEGFVRKVKRKNGYMYFKNPAVSILQDADRRLRFWLCEFGLTPASRTRVKVNAGDKDKENPAAKYLS